MVLSEYESFMRALELQGTDLIPDDPFVRCVRHNLYYHQSDGCDECRSEEAAMLAEESTLVTCEKHPEIKYRKYDRCGACEWEELTARQERIAQQTAGDLYILRFINSGWRVTLEQHSMTNKELSERLALEHTSGNPLNLDLLRPTKSGVRVIKDSDHHLPWGFLTPAYMDKEKMRQAIKGILKEKAISKVSFK